MPYELAGLDVTVTPWLQSNPEPEQSRKDTVRRALDSVRANPHTVAGADPVDMSEFLDPTEPPHRVYRLTIDAALVLLVYIAYADANRVLFTRMRDYVTRKEYGVDGIAFF